MAISPLISVEELNQILNNKNLVVVDARSGKDAKSHYINSHIKGAVLVDLETQLAHIKENFADGGRHPLPSIAKFIQVLNNLGIQNSSHIVVYDDMQGANAAARFWWMMRAIGHKAVQVLDGGLQEAIKINFPMETGINRTETSANYTANTYTLPQVDLAEISSIHQSNEYLIIDVRSQPRFEGKEEPIDLVAGHIPGACNIPLANNLNQDGRFKSSDELRKLYGKYIGNKGLENIIVHCGSGVTACHTLLAFDIAGLGIPKLYVGSWSEWSRNGLPIAKQ